MSTDHLVVVGAGLAGIRACESARREGFTGALTLVGSETHLPYDRPPLSKELLLADDEPALPTLRDESFLRSELDVDVRNNSAAIGLNTRAKTLHTVTGDIDYDAMVIAVGAHARTLPGVEGIQGVHTIRTFADAQSIWRALRARARVVVVGAGFIGAEVASAARKLGLPVTVVEAAPAPLTRSLGVDGGTLCADLHARNGTELILGVGVSGLRRRAGMLRQSPALSWPMGGCSTQISSSSESERLRRRSGLRIPTSLSMGLTEASSVRRLLLCSTPGANRSLGCGRRAT